MRNSLSGGPRWWVALAVAGGLAVAAAGPSVAHPVGAAAAPVAVAPADPDPGEDDPVEDEPVEDDPAEPGAQEPDPADGGSADVPEPAWVACRDGFQCARVDVPMDYDDPGAGTVSLALIRLPASDPDARLGSLFLNPGGPGGSGVEFARFIGKFMPLEVRQRYDIIGFDPRGVGLSDPLRCFATLDELFLSLPPIIFPLTEEEEKVWQEADTALAESCAERGGPLLNHMSTANVARDLDLLRRVVGDAELNFLGFSYGSVLGTTYANLFPDTVGALVVDGVVDPVAWTTGRDEESATTPVQVRTSSHTGLSRALGEFFRLCDEAGPDCAFSGDAEARYDALAESLPTDLSAIPDDPDALFFTYQDLVSFTSSILYAPPFWPDFAEILAEIEASAGGQETERQVTALRTALAAAGEPGEPDPDAPDPEPTPEPEPTPDQEEYPNFFLEGPLGVTCLDSDDPPADAHPDAADAAEEESRYFGRPVAWGTSPCSVWPGQDDDRYTGPWTAETSSTVLVVGNAFDPVTPLEGAVAVSELLPQSRLLTYAGWGHTAYLAGNYCIDRAVTSYLVSGDLPASGTVCAPEGSPFGPLEAGSADEPSVQPALIPDAALTALDRR